ncbi:uncharacterized protein LOC112549802 [Alligator sinensis]|uniref:Uncharacterized protein LOC112549802 n=1 Tax=Alligator sinensis TaxID=38654 RepID=A0A3Q0G9F9_ALLSI|nr:uncharacterized protein LOC112549802 [Alligator sinensis]
MPAARCLFAASSNVSHSLGARTRVHKVFGQSAKNTHNFDLEDLGVPGQTAGSHEGPHICCCKAAPAPSLPSAQRVPKQLSPLLGTGLTDRVVFSVALLALPKQFQGLSLSSKPWDWFLLLSSLSAPCSPFLQTDHGRSLGIPLNSLSPLLCPPWQRLIHCLPFPFSAQFLYSSYATLFSLSQAQTLAAGLATFELPWSQVVPLISSGMASFLPQLGAVSSASPESNPALG